MVGEKYLVYNIKEKRAVKFKDVYAFIDSCDVYKKLKLWNKVVVFEYPIQASNFLEKYFGCSQKDFIIKEVNKNGRHTKPTRK